MEASTARITSLDYYLAPHYLPSKQVLEAEQVALTTKITAANQHAESCSGRMYSQISQATGLLKAVNYLVIGLLFFCYGLWYGYESYRRNCHDKLLTRQTEVTNTLAKVNPYYERFSSLANAAPTLEIRPEQALIDLYTGDFTRARAQSIFEVQSGISTLPEGSLIKVHYATSDRQFPAITGIAMKILVDNKPKLVAIFYEPSAREESDTTSIIDSMYQRPTFTLYADGVRTTFSRDQNAIFNEWVSAFYEMKHFGYFESSSGDLVPRTLKCHLSTTANQAPLPSRSAPHANMISLS